MIRSALAGLPVAVGLLAFTGWLCDVPALERLYTPFVTMNPATAIGMMLSGSALMLIQHGGPGRIARLAAIVVSAIVLCGGALKLSDLTFHSSFAIDTRLFSAELAKAGPHNKMAPNAALAFVLLAGGIMIAQARSRIWIILSQLLSILAGLVAMLALVGYFYRVTPLYGFGSFTPMALPTALCFLDIGFGVLAIRMREGLLTCICNPGPAGRMSRSLLPASVLSVVGVGALRLAGIRSHLYTAEFGISLSVIVNIAMLLPLFWACARMLFAEDVKRGQIERQLHHRASHDLLTGLANRAVFFDRLQQRIDLMKRRGGPPFAVFYLDLDGFKQLNDQLGHEAGDRFLVLTAELLRECTRSTDTVARIGGDEFTILFEELDQTTDVAMLAQRILLAFPTQTGASPSRAVGISIGIAVSRAEYLIPEDILRDADSALYTAKTSGRGRYQIHRTGSASAATNATIAAHEAAALV